MGPSLPVSMNVAPGQSSRIKFFAQADEDPWPRIKAAFKITLEQLLAEKEREREKINDIAFA